MRKWKSGLLYKIVVAVNDKDVNDYESNNLYKKHKGLHLGKFGMKSKIIKDRQDNKIYSRRVWTGLYT